MPTTTMMMMFVNVLVASHLLFSFLVFLILYCCSHFRQQFAFPQRSKSAMIQITELFGILFREKIPVAETEDCDQQIVRSCDQSQIGVIVLETDISGNLSFYPHADDPVNVVHVDFSRLHTLQAMFCESIHFTNLSLFFRTQL